MEFAQIASDAYVKATDASLYTIGIEGVQWLQRALDLALTINDSERAQRIVRCMFDFYTGLSTRDKLAFGFSRSIRCMTRRGCSLLTRKHALSLIWRR